MIKLILMMHDNLYDVSSCDIVHLLTFIVFCFSFAKFRSWPVMKNGFAV